MSDELEVRDTRENRIHDALLRENLKAEQRRDKAQAARNYMFGGSGMLAGVGILLIGASFVLGNPILAGQVSQGVKQGWKEAAAETTFKTEVHGDLGVKPDAVVGVKGELSIKDTTLHLDRDPIMRAAAPAPADAPRAAPAEQARPDVTTPDVRTKFTIFRITPFGAGEVQSAAVYEDSAQKLPAKEYCLYSEPKSAGSDAVITLGLNGRLALPKNPPVGVNLLEAFAKCLWTNQHNQRSASK